MKALILAAGYATRLYPITNHKPKALLTIKGKPIIEYIIARIEQIKQVNEIIIVTNRRYLKEFRRWEQNYPAMLPTRILDDGSTSVQDKLGSVGDIAFAIKEAQIAEDLLVVGGDNLFSFNLAQFINASRLNPAVFIGAFNVNGNLQADKFGILKLDVHGKVVDFQEKPKSLNGSSLVSMCLYYFPAEKLALIQEYISQGNNCDRAGDYISWLSRQGAVYGYTFSDGNWIDVGDIDSYTEAVFTF